jgi:hypothetical protein
MWPARGAIYNTREVESVVRAHGTVVTAELRIETDGEYAGAVRVVVGGIQVASVPHESADAARAVVEQLHAAGKPATLRAWIDTEVPDVWLLSKLELWREGDPFLPMIWNGPDLQRTPEQEAWAEELLHSRAKTKRLHRQAEMVEADGLWRVIADGQAVGTLPRRAYPQLAAARTAGFPLTTPLDIIRQDGRALRVEIGCPDV